MPRSLVNIAHIEKYYWRRVVVRFASRPHGRFGSLLCGDGKLGSGRRRQSSQAADVFASSRPIADLTPGTDARSPITGHGRNRPAADVRFDTIAECIEVGWDVSDGPKPAVLEFRVAVDGHRYVWYDEIGSRKERVEQVGIIWRARPLRHCTGRPARKSSHLPERRRGVRFSKIGRARNVV